MIYTVKFKKTLNYIKRLSEGVAVDLEISKME